MRRRVEVRRAAWNAACEKTLAANRQRCVEAQSSMVFLSTTVTLRSRHG